MAQIKFKNFAFDFSNILFLWSICILINIVTFLFIFYKIHPGNKTLALHYNVLTGVEWYGKGKNLYFIPGVGLAILLINHTLYKTIKQTKEFLPSLIVFVSFFSQIILLVATLFLSQVN